MLQKNFTKSMIIKTICIITIGFDIHGDVFDGKLGFTQTRIDPVCIQFFWLNIQGSIS